LALRSDICSIFLVIHTAVLNNSNLRCVFPEYLQSADQAQLSRTPAQLAISPEYRGEYSQNDPDAGQAPAEQDEPMPQPQAEPTANPVPAEQDEPMPEPQAEPRANPVASEHDEPMTDPEAEPRATPSPTEQDEPMAEPETQPTGPVVDVSV